MDDKINIMEVTNKARTGKKLQEQLIQMEKREKLCGCNVIL